MWKGAHDPTWRTYDHHSYYPDTNWDDPPSSVFHFLTHQQTSSFQESKCSPKKTRSIQGIQLHLPDELVRIVDFVPQQYG